MRHDMRHLMPVPCGPAVLHAGRRRAPSAEARDRIVVLTLAAITLATILGAIGVHRIARPDPSPPAPRHDRRAAGVVAPPALRPVPRAESEPFAGMVLVPVGRFVPLYPDRGAAEGVAVPAFWLDRHAVTNADFLAFVRHNPEWMRSRMRPLFAERRYLEHWAGDLDLGPRAPADAPVVHVSWFAARAYARWRGKRLPTLAEWECVAAETDAADDDLRRQLLEWYSKPAPRVLPPVGSGLANRLGVADLYLLVWEWVDDFNTAMVTGESRGDGGLERQMFCGSGAFGAADVRDYAAFLRFAFRSSLEADYTIGTLGFRCARSAAVPEEER